MKAVFFKEHGGTDVLRYEEVEQPRVGPEDVLIRIKAAGMNRNDLWAREGLAGMKFPLPHISGSDAAGVVAEVGAAVKDIKIGDEIVVHPWISCRSCEACTSGQEYFCRKGKIWGFQTGPLDGSYAEYAAIPYFNAIPKPSNLGFEEAASIPLVLLTVWHMLATRAKLQPGEDVLIWGAGSGIGVIAIQVAKLFGARVIATAGSEEKLAKACELGADLAVNHYEDDVVKAVREFTGKKGVDVVFEHTGKDTWERSIASMGWGARLVVCGNTTGFEAKTDLRFVFNKQLNLLGSHQGTKAELLHAFKFVESGRIKPVVWKTFPLKDAAQAQEAMYAGKHFGNLVLVP
jgi:NADPH:quinone reductase-like Zn-dependent oxidoreductase